MVVTSILRILYGSLASHGAITRCLCICDEPLFLRLCSEGAAKEKWIEAPPTRDHKALKPMLAQ